MSMFCYQCEQTAGCVGCSGRAGVCGKSEAVAHLQDQLIGTLIGLARAAEGHVPDETTHRVMQEGLFATLTNVNFDGAAIERMIDEANAQRARLAPQCGTCANPCPHNEAYDMEQLWREPDEEVRSAKSLVLFGLKGMAAYAYHARALGMTDPELDAFFYRALKMVGEDWTAEALLELAMELGRMNLTCMELLDRANTQRFGTPQPTRVELGVEPGPFIVISGHDLGDLERLLKQTQNSGVNVYTHGEMLPAHGYPKLRAYPHLKGHFGTAWQNQQREFDGLPAPVLFTTNCLMPPKPSYADRVFTTAVVGYPGLTHLDGEQDFTPVIERALALGGYPQRHEQQGVNGGTAVTTGFGHAAVLGAARQVLEAVHARDLNHIFLVGGCDGARGERGYFTEFVKATPSDTLVLTLACGKFRFNDLELGAVAGLPRLMDMGQCNDAYGAIRVALALAEALGCGVNELPLSLVLSWYEQKAVCILLTLLSLGVKRIVLGPTLPAFISPTLLNLLVERFEIAPVTTPEADLTRLMNR